MVGRDDVLLATVPQLTRCSNTVSHKYTGTVLVRYQVPYRYQYGTFLSLVRAYVVRFDHFDFDFPLDLGLERRHAMSARLDCEYARHATKQKRLLYTYSTFRYHRWTVINLCCAVPATRYRYISICTCTSNAS